jgi:hypothetical protein
MTVRIGRCRMAKPAAGSSGPSDDRRQRHGTHLAGLLFKRRNAIVFVAPAMSSTARVNSCRKSFGTAGVVLADGPVRPAGRRCDTWTDRRQRRVMSSVNTK